MGKIIGVTKERVRQIQNKALAKIRKLMEDGVLRTKTAEQPDEESAPGAAEDSASPPPVRDGQAEL